MKKTIVLLGSILFFLLSCGDDHKETFAPGIPAITLDIDNRIITWDSVAGADSYNLYYKKVTGCPDITAAPVHEPTKDDTLIENVTSPFSIADYKGDTDCYYAGVTAKNTIGESNVSIGVGWQIYVTP